MVRFEGISQFFHYKEWTEFSAMLVFSWLDPPLHITILCKYFRDIDFSVCRPYRRYSNLLTHTMLCAHRVVLDREVILYVELQALSKLWPSKVSPDVIIFLSSILSNNFSCGLPLGSKLAIIDWKNSISSIYRCHVLQKKGSMETTFVKWNLLRLRLWLFSTTGGMGRERLTFYRRLAELLSRHAYSDTLAWLHCTLSFSLRSATLCIYTGKSLYLYNASPELGLV